MAYSYDLVVALGSAQTGLTLTASVRDTAGTALGSQPAYTVVEHGGGWYSYHTSAMPDGHRGVVRLLSGATVMAAAVVTPIETENADVKTSTRGTSTYAGGAVASVTAPVTAGTVSDKSGYSLSGTQAFDLTGNITGNLSGSVGSVTGSVGSVTGAVTVTGTPAVNVTQVNGVAATTPAGVDLNAGAIADNLAAWKADADVITLLAASAALDLMIVDDGAGAYEYTAGALANAPAGGGSAPTAADIWAHGTRTLTAAADPAGVTTLLARIPGTVAAQTGDAYARLGAPAGASHAADVAAIKADTAAIKLKTDNLPASPANEVTLTTIAGYLDTEVAAILAAVDTEVAAIKAKTDLIPDLAATGTVTGTGGTTTTLVGDSGLSSTDDFYVGAVLAFTSGALKGTGGRRIGDYVGSTRTFSFAEAWPAAPANGTTFVILGRIDPPA